MDLFLVLALAFFLNRSQMRLKQRYLFCLVLARIPYITSASAGDDYGPFGPIIGIDLGTTYSCVGIYRAGRVEIIANSQGERTTPSWVAFRDDERLIGSPAKNAFHSLPTRTIYSVKRLIGRAYEDPEVQQDIAHWPFSVIRENRRAAIQVLNQERLDVFTPEEISAMILLKLKEMAEAYLGMRVTHAVITVPAYFTDAQRQATKDAGTIAGLTVIRILNEPTAAAIAYGLDRKRSGESRIIVYDLGGGTFDVSLLSVQNGLFRVLAMAGDSHLGGEDFDARLIDHFISLYKRRFGVDVATSQRVMSKLKREVERAKRTLSDQKAVSLEIDSFYRGQDLSETLSRARFEQLNNDLFRKTLGPVRKVLDDAKIGIDNMDDIVLVGGSTRIPKIRELLKEMFGGKEPSQGINPDEAVAIGAAINAGMIAGQTELADYEFVDISPYTIGIETGEGDFTPFIHRNTPIPSSHSKTLSTVEDNQSVVLIKVYQGENTHTKDNTFLGEFELSGIPSVVRGIAQIDVKFDLDASNILCMEAKERFSGNSKSIEIACRRSGLSQDEVDRLATRAKEYTVYDKARIARMDKVNSLQTYLWDLDSRINDRRFMVSMMKKGLEENEFTASLGELDQKMAEIKSVVEGKAGSAASTEVGVGGVDPGDIHAEGDTRADDGGDVRSGGHAQANNTKASDS
ncbi:ATPase with role in protein import into the ER [Ceratobasidium sp. UAMH 11750]|nr:ATPase with role in protein import into the ER [Ceratobasidium sp. UAMH 11750]